MSINTATDKLLLKLATPALGKPMGAVHSWVLYLEILRQGGLIDYSVSPTTPGVTNKPWLEPTAPSLNIYNGSAWVAATIAQAFPNLVHNPFNNLKFIGRFVANMTAGTATTRAVTSWDAGKSTYTPTLLLNGSGYQHYRVTELDLASTDDQWPEGMSEFIIKATRPTSWSNIHPSNNGGWVASYERTSSSAMRFLLSHNNAGGLSPNAGGILNNMSHTLNSSTVVGTEPSIYANGAGALAYEYNSSYGKCHMLNKNIDAYHFNNVSGYNICEVIEVYKFDRTYFSF